MTDLLTLAAICIGLPLAAAWGHELVHAATAGLLGATVHKIDLLYLYVDFEFDGEEPFRETLVYLSPTIVGIGVLPVMLVLWNGGVGILPFMAFFSWLIFALSGGSEQEISIYNSLIH